MTAEEKKLLEIAALVSDGQAVDWENAERSMTDREDRRVIRHLRVVQSLAEAHSTPGDQTTDFVDGTVTSACVTPDIERWGRLEIREQLGQGSFGQVFRAWDANLQHEVALKLLLPPSKGRTLDEEEFLKEGRMLARLRHPNVITVHSAEIHDGRVGISMELVQGSTLSELLHERGRLGAREAALIGVDLCRALAAVHGAGLVHQDVKAENVMRGDGGRILLMDFGAGRELKELMGSDSSGISGTPFYMAPEVILKREATPRSDLYGLGVLLYHLVTRGFPVQASSMRALAKMHEGREARLLRDARSDLPEAFVKVVERALAWDPERRFGSAGEMEQALADAPLSPAQPGRHRFARSPALAVAALFMIAAAIFGWWASRDEQADNVIPAAEATGVTMSYDVEAALYRVSEDRHERLASGARLVVGDELSLEIQGSVPLHVYVFDRDSLGQSFALFPLADFVLQNPLQAGTRHVLPGLRMDGSRKAWQVDTAGGREQLVVLASPEPLIKFEEELRRLPQPRPGAVAQPVPPETLLHLRGIGGLSDVSGPESAESGSRLFKMARELAGGAERVEGVWMRQIELLNPVE